MQGRARILGHPLHLISVSFPVSFWTGSVVTDIAGAASHDAFWFRMSATLVLAGSAVGVLASIAGFIDERTMPLSSAAQRLVAAHRWWSLVTLAVFVAASAFRLVAYASPVGIVLTACGSILLLVAAYIGSDAAVRFGLGVRDDAFKQLRVSDEHVGD